MRKPVFIGLILAAVGAAAVISYVATPHIQDLITDIKLANPKTAQDWRERGYKEAGEGKLADAAQSFTRAMELEPSNPEHLLLRAVAYSDDGKFAEALADYDTALKQSNAQKTTALIHINRARIFIAQGKNEGGLTELAQALTAAPNDPEIFNYRAMLKFYMNDFPGAAADFTAALGIQPSYFEARHGLGITYYTQRDWAKAADHLGQARVLAKGSAANAMWAILARMRNGETINPADFADIDRQRWPGQTVAHLLGQKDLLDNLIETAAKDQNPLLAEFICVGTFASLSLIQIENRVAKVSEEYAGINAGASFLDDTYKIFEKCPPGVVEGLVGKKEIETIKAQ
jgi:tetratricopeptide (TPR) repeat protein